MRLLAGALLAASVAAGPAAAAAGPVSATLSSSSDRPAAHHVRLTLSLVYEMQCSYPGRGPLTISLPRAMVVPARISTASVLVDGKAPPSVAMHGHAVVVGMRPPPQIMCDVIGPGRLTVVLTAGAGLGNPAVPGSYPVSVAVAGVRASAPLRIA